MKRSIDLPIDLFSVLLLLAVWVNPLSAEPPAAQKVDEINRSAKQVATDKPEPTLDGYCPVSYQMEPTPVGGDPAIHIEYRNKLYYFANEDAKKKFIAEPERFVPQYDGLCTTALGGPYGNRFKGDPTVFAVVDKRLYLFSSERAKRAFETRPDSVISKGNELFAKPRLDGMCVVSYLTRKTPVKGSSEAAYPYRQWSYHFAGLQERSQFMQNPEKFMPQYDTHCTEAMSRGLQYPSNPEHVVIYDGKTYLFLNEKAQSQFSLNPPKMIRQANEHWEVIKKRPGPDPGR